MNVLQIIIRATSGNTLKVLNAVNSAIRTLTSVSAAAATGLSLLIPGFRNLRFIITDFGNAITSVISLFNELLTLAVSVVSQLLSVFTAVFNKIADIVKAVMGTVVSVVFDSMKKVADIVIQAGREAGKNWLEFERESDRIFGLIANEVGASFDEIKRMSLSLSTQLGKDIGGIQKALFSVISAGFRDVAEAGEVVFQAGQLAKAGWVEVGETIEPIISIINAYGLAAKDAERVAALMFETQVRGRGTMQEFAKLLGQVLPIAKALNISMEDAAAATAAVTRTMGAQGRVMFSTVSALNQLAKPTKSAAKAWQAVGFSVTRAADGSIDLKKTIEDLARVVKRNPDILKKMFPQRAGLRGISIMIEQLKNTIDYTRNSAASLANFGAAVQSTEIRMSFLIEKVTALWKNFGIVVVDILQTVLQPLLEDVIALFDKFAKAVTEIKIDDLIKNLKELIRQFRNSEIWKFILSAIGEALNFLLALVPKITSVLHDFVAAGKTADVLNSIFFSIRDALIDIYNWLITLKNNWGPAWEGMKVAAQQLFDLLIIGLGNIDINFNVLINETIPNFIAALKSINIPELLAEWLVAFRDFAVNVTQIFTSIAQSIAGVFAVAFNQVIKVLNEIIKAQGEAQLYTIVPVLTVQAKLAAARAEQAQNLLDEGRRRLAAGDIEGAQTVGLPRGSAADPFRLEKLQAEVEAANAELESLGQQIDDIKEKAFGSGIQLIDVNATKGAIEIVGSTLEQVIKNHTNAAIAAMIEQAKKAQQTIDAANAPPAQHPAEAAAAAAEAVRVKQEEVQAAEQAAKQAVENAQKITNTTAKNLEDILLKLGGVNLEDGIDIYERALVEDLKLKGEFIIDTGMQALEKAFENIPGGNEKINEILKSHGMIEEYFRRFEVYFRNFDAQLQGQFDANAQPVDPTLGVEAARKIEELKQQQEEEKARIKAENDAKIEEMHRRQEEEKNRIRERQQQQAFNNSFQGEDSLRELQKLNRGIGKLTPVYVGSIG